jgi:acyl transferase domain-containing protein/NADPH:quinone reductase-like Zn-dependent oxidoreductase/NAD(P)-dependent dehydrogenase (short-subunit alcohol dehydrogenase family)/acyl carrier protein
MTKPVAIIGQAFRFPATDAQNYWNDLLAGRDLVSQVPTDRWTHSAFLHPDKQHPGTAYTFAAGTVGDVSQFDPAFFGISPREAAQMDPQQRLLLELGYEAICASGYTMAQLRGSNTGVYIGIASADYSYRMADDLTLIDSAVATGNTASIAANRLSYVFDLRGPSMAIDTACSSSLVAFHQAVRAIQSGESKLALCGGVSLHLHPYGFIIFSKASMLSPRGRCQVFDASGDGYVRSEGGGLFLLKDYQQALADGDPILAVVAGTAVNTDGRKSGITVPSCHSQAALLEQVYANAGISLHDIDYIEAHGTGTAVGDPIETRALGRAIGSKRSAGNPLYIGSVKSNLGHLEAASGVAGLVKAIYSLQHRTVPATIGIRTLNPAIDFAGGNLQVVQQPLALKAEGQLTIGVNSFGFGGSNAHVILQSAPDMTPPAVIAHPVGQKLPLLLSSQQPEGLTATVAVMADHLRSLPDGQWYDCCYQALFRRDWFSQRLLLWAESASEAVSILDRYQANNQDPAVVVQSCNKEQQPLVWVYSGNGCQWHGMGAALLQHDVFAGCIAEIDQTFLPLAGYSLRAELAGELAPERVDATEYAQPALFALQVGLTRMLRAEGLEAAAVVGHSVGEVAAAWAAGILSLPQACQVIYHRSRLQGQTRGQGQMSAAAISAAEARDLIDELGLSNQLTIAGVNSASGVTLAGDADALSVIETHLQQQRVFCRRLALDYAFHSPAMDPIASELLQVLAEIRPQTGQLAFYSTVFGAKTAGTALDAHYWWQNIREPVLFHDAISTMVQDGLQLYAELGGHPVLRGYLTEALQGQSGLCFGALKRQQAEIADVAQLRDKLILSGAQIDWSGTFPLVAPQHSLPPYQWQRQRCWLDQDAESVGQLYRPSVHPLLGAVLPQMTGCWQQTLDTALLPWLSEHQVGNAVVLPGSGFAELALAAAAQLCPAGPLVVEDLEIQAPMLLEAGQSRILRTEVDVQDGSLRFSSRVLLADTGLQPHGKGRLLLQPDLATVPVKAPAIPARAADFDRRQQDTATQLLDLQYGPHFRQVSQGWRLSPAEQPPHSSGQTVLAELALPDGSACDFPDYLLHPGVLDSSFQLIIQALYPNQSTEFTYIPVAIGRLELYQRRAVPVLAQLTLRRHSPFSILADFWLFDKNGHLIAHLAATRFKRTKLKNARPAPQLWQQISRPDALAPLQPLALPDFAVLADSRQQLCQELEPLLNELVRRSLQQQLQPWQHNWADVFSELELRQPATAGYLQQLLTHTALSSSEFTAVPDDDLSPQALWRALLTSYPAYGPLLLQAGQALQQVPLLLQGQSMRLPDDTNVSQLLQNRLYSLLPGLAAQLNLWAQDASRPLQLLEYSPEEPLLCPTLLAAPTRLQLAFLSAEPSLDAQQLAANYPVLSLPAANSRCRVDALWFWSHYADLTAARAALQQACQQLQPGGYLLIPLQKTGLWSDLLFGPQHPLLSTQSASFWQQLLPDWTVQILALADAGLELLIATAPVAATPPVTLPPLVLLDGAADYRSDAFTVIARGQISALAELEPGSWPADTLVLYQPQVAQADDSAPALTGPQALLSCEQAGMALVQLQQWALQHSPNHPIWLLLPDASLHSAATPAQTSVLLWGLGRTLRNEHPVPVSMLDFAGGQNPLALLAAELQAGSDAREVHYDRGQVRYTPHLEPIPRPLAAQHYQLQISQPGQLRHLQWQATQPLQPAPGQIRVDVQATGLNFRDVMYALGLLSDEALEQGFAGPTLGLEFAGTVSAVGAGVSGYQPGDRVLGFGPASFAAQVVTSASAVAHLPSHIDFAAAATIPSTFFTAYYALHHLAQLEAGETVLIHGAAGGVGIAAIQIAQWKGARVIATAGAAAKHAFLRQLGVQDILDSRSLQFADQVMALTQGQGVDVVLNSLAGEAVNRNLKILKPFGRFLELGKRDFYDNSKIGLRPFRNNISYFGIDADQMMACRPALTARLFSEMMQLFADDILWPLPYQSFAASQIESAFRQMQQARHIGKIVVEYPAALPVQPRQQPLQLRPDRCYLVTGGMDGFGLATAKALAAMGARQLLLLSRRGERSPDAAATLASFAAQGVTVHAPACDVSDRQALEQVLTDARQQLLPLGGVVHAAAVIEDSLLQNLSAQTLHKVLAAKLQGGWLLDELTRTLQPDTPLDFFVVYSSATTLFGNPGQAAYVAANYGLEMLCQTRRAAGLPATALLWGAIDDAGFLARNTEIKAALQSRMGGQAVTTTQAMQALSEVLQRDLTQAAVLDIDITALQKFLPAAADPRFSRLREQQGTRGNMEQEASQQDVAALLAAMPVAEAQAYLLSVLKQVVGGILRANPDKLAEQVPLQDLGLDSLMGVELVVAIENQLGVRLPVLAISEQPTLQSLAHKLLGLLSTDAAPEDMLTAQIRQVAGSHGSDISAAELRALQQQLTSQPQQRLIKG